MVVRNSRLQLLTLRFALGQVAPQHYNRRRANIGLHRDCGPGIDRYA